MALKDWSELDSGTLDLPIRGKVYRIESPPGRVGMRVQAFLSEVTAAVVAQEQGREVDLDAEVLSDAAELKLTRDVLGERYEEMLADGVPTEAIKRALAAVMAWISQSREAAEAVWEGKAPPSLVPSGAASTTRRRASTSGTSGRKAKKPTAAAAKRSAGKRS